MYTFLAVFAIIGLVIFALHRKYKQEDIQIQKERDYIKKCNHYFNLLNYKISSFKTSDEECLSLIREAYMNCVSLSDTQLCEENGVENRLIQVLNNLAMRRLEEHCKNIGLLKEIDQRRYFMHYIYHENECLIESPKFHFEEYFSKFIKRYNRVFYKNVGKELIEESFDVESFIKDIEEVHKMYITIKVKVMKRESK